jgi:hypothetical protein
VERTGIEPVTSGLQSRDRGFRLLPLSPDFAQLSHLSQGSGSLGKSPGKVGLFPDPFPEEVAVPGLQAAPRLLRVSGLIEQVRVDVEGDRGASVAELPGEPGDVFALLDEQARVGVPEVVPASAA